MTETRNQSFNSHVVDELMELYSSYVPVRKCPPKCSVSGCQSKGGRQFCFPRTIERALKWKEFCKNPKLDRHEPRDLWHYFRICSKHFDVPSFTYPSSGRLLRSAMPTIYPPTQLIIPKVESPELASPTATNPDHMLPASFPSSAPPLPIIPKVESPELASPTATNPDYMLPVSFPSSAPPFPIIPKVESPEPASPTINNPDLMQPMSFASSAPPQIKFSTSSSTSDILPISPPPKKIVASPPARISQIESPSSTTPDILSSSTSLRNMNETRNQSFNSSHEVGERMEQYSSYVPVRKCQPKCSVSGCQSKGGKQFCFPRTIERALKWKEFCKNPKLDGHEPRNFWHLFRICSKHFDVPSFTYPSSGRLLRSAMPTICPPTHPIPNLDSSDLTSSTTTNPDNIPPMSSASCTPPQTAFPTSSTTSHIPSISPPPNKNASTSELTRTIESTPSTTPDTLPSSRFIRKVPVLRKKSNSQHRALSKCKRGVALRTQLSLNNHQRASRLTELTHMDKVLCHIAAYSLMYYSRSSTQCQNA